MLAPIISPLQYYQNKAKSLHANNVRAFLELAVKESKVDKTENAKTVQVYDNLQTEISTRQTQISKKKSARAWAIVGAILLAVCLVGVAAYCGLPLPLVITLGLLLCVAGIVVLVKTNKTHKSELAKLMQDLQQYQKKADAVLQQAKQQTFPLCYLLTDKVALQLVSKTMPCFAFDEYLSQERFSDLVQKYGLQNSDNELTYTIDTLSGELYGSPFLYLQTCNHYMGTKTYTGSLHISWTTTSKDSQGKTVTHHHSQTLHASLVRPYPYFNLHTAMYYGNEAVPNVDFSRTYQHVEDKTDKQVSRTIRRGERKIERLENTALKAGDDFMGVLNSEFDVLFGATNRTDDYEFREMFTPRAQESMLELLRYADGYGDDFTFSKSGTLCTIVSEHMQRFPLTPVSASYQSHDLQRVEQLFIEENEEFFKSLYFDFAPLLLIPPYQQPLIPSNAANNGTPTYHTREALAWRLQDRLLPSDADTEGIYKTELIESNNGVERVRVSVLAYRKEARRSYESVFGGDGRMHSVPIDWYEYIPTHSNAIITLEPTTPYNASPETATKFHGFFAYVV